MLALLLFRPAFAATEVDDLSKDIEKAISAKDYQQAQTILAKQLESLPEGSMERGCALMQRSEVSKKLGLKKELLKDQQRADAIISEHVKNHQNMNDSEFDKREAEIRDREREFGGPCFYISSLERSVKRSWFPGNHQKSKQTKVQFTIHRNGKLANLRITEFSGLLKYDTAALSAIIQASPFYPLPIEAPPSIEMEFTFAYNIKANSAK